MPENQLNMKTHIRTILAASLLGIFTGLLPAFADDEDSRTSFGTRYSAAIDKKIIKGLHIDFEEELRLDGISSLDKSYTSLGISYKICPYLKVGAGYSAIAARREDDSNPGSMTWDWRHRGTFDLTGMIKEGAWKFSLRERLQATRKTRSVNTWEQPQTALALKSRFKASYTFHRQGLEPYAFIEHRLLLNGAKWDSRATDANEYSNSSYIGNSDVYTNRLRSQIGLKWEISKKNALEIYCLYDNITDKEIDSKKNKPILKVPVSKVERNYTAIGIGYTFSF